MKRISSCRRRFIVDNHLTKNVFFYLFRGRD